MSTFYTDGSCLQNPGGPGGWALVELNRNKNDVESCIYGGDPSTTNNRMELEAILQILENYSDELLTIHTDSQYVINCATGKWKRNKNIDMWDRYNKLAKDRKVNFIWVKGHNGDIWNEFVDNLAREYAENIREQI